ncbi:MAG: hypothetical protein WCA22_18815 [Candidatus Binatus sp.]
MSLNGNGTELASYLPPPALIAELNPQELASLIGQLEQLKALCWARLVTTPVTTTKAKPDSAQPDRTLNAEEIAAELGQTRRWVFRHAKKLSFIRRTSRKSLTASATEVRRWRETQRA